MAATARSACVRALLEWEKGRAYADEILHEMLEARPLSPLDRGFFFETFFGILRNLSELDFLIAQLRPEPTDAQTRAVLQLGLYQIFHMRTPAHAAVHESVELGGRARGVINAVLRRALREKEALEQKLAEAAPDVRMSHPRFLLARWEEHFGAEATERLCAWNNRPAEIYVRVNGLKVTLGELLRSARDVEPIPAHPRAIRVRQLPFTWVLNGLCYVQDPSTLLACDLLAPQPGETILDACAAPGGKATYLAELMDNQGHLVACDLFPSRVERLRENLTRLGVLIAEPLVHDCMHAGGALAYRTFDRILIDAPCSNTGVMRRRVDVRWRLSAEDFIRLPPQQVALVKRTSQLLKPGGTLVYSTCSLEPEENEEVVDRIIEAVPSLRFLETRRALPFADEVDGAFAAKFVRTA